MNNMKEMRFGPLSPGELEHLDRLRKSQNPRKYGPARTPGKEHERPHVYDNQEDTEQPDPSRGRVEIEILNASNTAKVNYSHTGKSRPRARIGKSFNTKI